MHTVKYETEHRLTAGLGQNPRPILPGWIMPDVLCVTAFELGHPMALVVDMEADDSPRLAPRSAQLVDEP